VFEQVGQTFCMLALDRGESLSGIRTSLSYGCCFERPSARSLRMILVEEKRV